MGKSKTDPVKPRRVSNGGKKYPSVLVDVIVEETKPPGPFDGLSMWNFLKSELNLNLDVPNTGATTKSDTGDGLSLDLLLNFVKLPLTLENFMTFGLFYFFVVFIHWLIVIPLRGVIHSLLYIRNAGIAWWNKTKRKGRSLSSMLKFKNDLITISCLILTLYKLLQMDTSKIYHNIRAGTAIKLYFMVQVLEIFDRLLSSSGQDISKLVYNNSLFKSSYGSKQFKFNLFRVFTFGCSFVVMFVYLWFHSYILIYQVMALNVAINSYSNALLTMILSNQFSELKSSVFKRTEREGLFQITCSDLNERFLLLIMLVIISSRNLLQICLNSTSIHDLFINIKPNSWYSNFTSSKYFDDWFGLLLGPSIVVLGTEILVDWVKHAYIIRFNRINHRVYNRFNSILAIDLINEFNSNNDEFSNLIIKRTGFPIFAVIIVFIKLSVFPWVHFIWDKLGGSFSLIHIGLFSLIFIIGVALALALKFVLTIILLKWSHFIISPQKPQQPNDYMSGVPNTQLSQINDIRHKLYNENEKVPPDQKQKRASKANGKRLEDVVRFEMEDKRIW